MGLLDRTKAASNTPANQNSTNSNLKITGSKKASYSFLNEAEETLEAKNFHDNPVFEAENNAEQPKEKTSNNIELESKVCQETEPQGSSFAVASNTTLLYISAQTKEQSSSEHSSPYKTADRLAAAAAAAVSSTVTSVVEIPNFSEGLSPINDKQMEEIEISSKCFESKISQSHGFTFGDAHTKNSYTKSVNPNAASSILSDDDGIKLTPCSFDIKIRRRRACQLKALVILLAMFAASCMGCIMAYFFFKYNMEHERYLKYTQNMVAERNSKHGSNRLEIIVPFDAHIATPNEKLVLSNKIQEIVLDTFSHMNKTVEVIQLYKCSQVANGSYEAIIDVELSNAVEFAVTPLKLNTGRVILDPSSRLLNAYQLVFKNITQRLNLNPAMMRIDFNRINIAFDEKSDAAKKMQDGSRILSNLSQHNETLESTRREETFTTTTTTLESTTSIYFYPSETTHFTTSIELDSNSLEFIETTSLIDEFSLTQTEEKSTFSTSTQELTQIDISTSTTSENFFSTVELTSDLLPFTTELSSSTETTTEATENIEPSIEQLNATILNHTTQATSLFQLQSTEAMLTSILDIFKMVKTEEKTSEADYQSVNETQLFTVENSTSSFNETRLEHTIESEQDQSSDETSSSFDSTTLDTRNFTMNGTASNEMDVLLEINGKQASLLSELIKNITETNVQPS